MEFNGLNTVGRCGCTLGSTPGFRLAHAMVQEHGISRGRAILLQVLRPGSSIFFCQPQFKDVGVGVLRIHHINIISMATSSRERPCC
jgi:hypothetical protein